MSIPGTLASQESWCAPNVIPRCGISRRKRQRHQRKIVDRDKHLCDCCHYYRSFTLAKSGYTVFTYDDGTLLTHEEFTELIAKALPFYRLSEEDRADALYLASGGPVQGQ